VSVCVAIPGAVRVYDIIGKSVTKSRSTGCFGEGWRKTQREHAGEHARVSVRERDEGAKSAGTGERRTDRAGLTVTK